MANIIRIQTPEEKADFKDISRKHPTPEQKFNDLVAKKQLEAQKKGLPFCDKAARDDWKNFYADKKQKLKRQGYLDKGDSDPNIDWAKYSDLKNFKVIEEGETYDDELSKRHNLTVYAKKTTYVFKGYEKYPITIMEDGPSSIKRAAKLKADSTK